MHRSIGKPLLLFACIWAQRALAAFRKLALTEGEFAQIAGNLAPYLR